MNALFQRPVGAASTASCEAVSTMGEMREIGDVLHVNDGDWLESCTALAEHDDGRLELIDWAGRRRLSFLADRLRRRDTGWHAPQPVVAR